MQPIQLTPVINKTADAILSWHHIICCKDRNRLLSNRLTTFTADVLQH